mmetsp:Transcript_24219/g.51346  ORF Transcript_24219/g.51346 Transcript_24219/m.51346 type:complete len:87 (+) Transcript_24219:38-298(+)
MSIFMLWSGKTMANTPTDAIDLLCMTLLLIHNNLEHHDTIYYRKNCQSPSSASQTPTAIFYFYHYQPLFSFTTSTQLCRHERCQQQ